MIKYMHVERLSSDEVEGILSGEVFIQPKLDGTNGQIYYDELEIKCASRRMELSKDKTNQGFWDHVFMSEYSKVYEEYFKNHPHHVLYGEWLVPHTLKTYRKEAWNRFYVFDVFNSYNGLFIKYDKYFDSLNYFEIPYVPVIGKLYNPKEEDLLKYLDKNTFLIEDGKGIGEGIVIKNYDFINRYGRVTWAKIVRNEFKEENVKVMGYLEENPKSKEVEIINTFLTEGRINKVKAKMLEDSPWNNKRIPEYLNRVWFDLIQDEMWNIIKKFKNPTVDFNYLNRLVISKIKEIDKEVF